MLQRDAQTLWDTLCRSLSNRLQERTYLDWVSPCAAVAYDERAQTLWIRTPSNSEKFWIEHQLAEEFHDALIHADLADLKLIFTPAGETAEKPADAPVERRADAVKTSAPRQTAPLAEASVFPQGFDRYTLENFVVGKSSQFAYSAARAIVEKQGGRNSPKKMNPLFIYGGSGLGKTHLMVGIGKGLLAASPKMRLAYVKMDSFFHELTGAIRAKNTEPVRKKYQSNDTLLIDDIQTLQGMERTQEEIFYIIEHLLLHGRQIVITSDNPRLEGLSERLATRCKWGLTVDIQPPDFETRVAILKQKLEDPAFADYPGVPDEALFFIANKAKASVRDLEGLLTRIVFQASFLGAPVTLEVAQDAYRGMTGEESSASVSLERICRQTAKHFQISVNDLIKKKTRTQGVLVPRQVAMYLARELTAASYEEIGRSFSNKHHSTVMNSIDSVKKRMQRDPDFNKAVLALLNSID